MGRARRWLVAGAITAVVTIGVPAVWAHGSSHGHIGGPEDVPPAPVALVLGAGVREDGRPTRLLAGRLDVAARLYLSGRVDVLLLSGSTGPDGYDEPGTMRAYLARLGVSERDMVLDPDGLSTWDSCVRASDVFGVSEAVVVSQSFHLPRAVALCRAAGIDAWGVGHDSARDNPGGTRVGRLRETLANGSSMLRGVLRKAPAVTEAPEGWEAAAPGGRGY